MSNESSTASAKNDLPLLYRINQWIVSPDTGISSVTIWSAMMGVPNPRKWTPSDPSDFGRCYRLLKMIPEWELRLDELRALGPNWVAFVDHYEEMKVLYEEEFPTGKAPRLYALMKSLCL